MKRMGIGECKINFVIKKSLTLALFTLLLLSSLTACKEKRKAKAIIGTDAEESASINATDETTENSADAGETTESSASEDLAYDAAAVNKSNVFANYPGDAIWKSNSNEYRIIPYIKDGKEFIEFRLYGEPKFLLEGLSFAKTENNGLRVSGKMRNLKDNSWNGDADVIWDSLEAIDYPKVDMNNGTEFTDVDMVGDYTYAGKVSATEQSNGGTEINTSEFIFPFANERLISKGEYESLDSAALRLAINEIYARHGRQYDTQVLLNLGIDLSTVSRNLIRLKVRF